jgi:enoyl-CoA hydratase/carnithine racemase
MHILCEIRNHLAFVTLNRPQALNALSLDMVSALHKTLRDIATDSTVRAVLLKGAGEKAFCAGGDIRALYHSYQSSGNLHREFFAAEYPVDYFLRFYPKPYIALMDGITMGGGMGLAQGSRIRIVGDRTRIAMPEVAIGFFPDVGASYFLSRIPGELGLYLALTGAPIQAGDALYAGLADAYLTRESVNRLEMEFSHLVWGEDPRGDIERCIEDLKSPLPGVASLADLRPAIDEHFAGASVTAILESLDSERRPQYADWARQASCTIKTRSPTMLAVTLRQLRQGRHMSYAQCLRMEIGIAQRCFEQGDFLEGVRAVIIDKDNRAHWRPDQLAEVTDASVDAFFVDPWHGTAHPLAKIEENF